MDTLPVEIIDMILALVGPLPHARAVCRQWRALIDGQTGQWRPPSAGDYMALLAQNNAQTVIQWVRSNGCPWDAAACAGAARGGHLGLLKWLRDSGCPWDVLTYGWAMARQDHEMVAWLVDARCPAKIRRLWNPAIRGGHMEIIDWLLRSDHEWPWGSCCHASEAGRLDIFQRAKTDGVRCLLCEWCPIPAAREGHIHILEWLCQRGEITPRQWKMAAIAAAEAGRLDVIQWIAAHGGALCKTTMSYAAAGGHRHVIAWLRDHGQDWWPHTMVFAIKYGHFDLLPWLYEQGCALTAEAFLEASRRAHLSTLEWLRSHRCPLNTVLCTREAHTDEAKTLIATCAHLDGAVTGRWSRTIDDE
jgi:hypothetical protein